MSCIYLDACCIIYLIEAKSQFHGKVISRLAREATTPDARLVTSGLSRLECRTRPLQEQDHALLAAYDAFFAADRLVLAEISAAVIERATELRAKYGFRTPDAIHLATAIEEEVDLVLTGDERLKRFSEISIEILQL